MRKRGVTAEQMSEIDRRAQEEYGISQSVLMENAGRAVAEEIMKDLGRSSASGRQASVKIAVFCGKGNNGGDGFVAARLLMGKGMNVAVYAPAAGEMKDGAAADNFKRAQNMGLDIRPLRVLSPQGSDIAVDAIFGTGFTGELSDEYADICKAINLSGMKTYAVDIPSGLNASTGIASRCTPVAFKTVTFGLPKAGFYINDGPRVCGDIVVRDIGFPPELLQKYS